MVTTSQGEVVDPRTTLQYYHPSVLRNAEVWTVPEMRKEYSRLRSIARKRLERMGRTKYRDSEVYRQNIGQYVPVKEIRSEVQLRKKLQEVAWFVAAKRGSVTGLRQAENKAVETLRAHGYTAINKKNIGQFGEYMEQIRARAGAAAFDSGGAYELFSIFSSKESFREGRKITISENDFNFFTRHREQLMSLDLGPRASARAYRKAIEELSNNEGADRKDIRRSKRRHS